MEWSDPEEPDIDEDAPHVRTDDGEDGAEGRMDDNDFDVQGDDDEEEMTQAERERRAAPGD